MFPVMFTFVRKVSTFFVAVAVSQQRQNKIEVSFNYGANSAKEKETAATYVGVNSDCGWLHKKGAKDVGARLREVSAVTGWN